MRAPALLGARSKAAAVAVAVVTATMTAAAPAAAEAAPVHHSVFTAPYSAASTSTQTDCPAGADLCTADVVGGTSGVFQLSSEVARGAVATAAGNDITAAFGSVRQRIKVPRGVSRLTVDMTFEAVDLAVRADSTVGTAQADVAVLSIAPSGYCASCTVTEGRAVLARSLKRSGVPLPGDTTGPRAVITLTITAPPGSSLPARALDVAGVAASTAALLDDSCPLCGAVPGRAGSAASSAGVTLTEMRASFA